VDEADFDVLKEAVSQLRELEGVRELEALVSLDLFELLVEIMTTDNSFASVFRDIDIIVVPEMPEGEMVIVPAGTDPQSVVEILKASRAEEQEEDDQLAERKAEWLNWLERKEYVKVIDNQEENGRTVKVVDVTDEGKRIMGTQEFQYDKTWFFETGQLPKEK